MVFIFRELNSELQPYFKKITEMDYDVFAIEDRFKGMFNLTTRNIV